MFLFFIFLLFALPSLSGHLRLYLFGLFIYLHIYRTVPTPSIPLGPFLFCLSYSKYVCLLLRYPRCSSLSCRLSSSRRVDRVIKTASRIDEYVSLLLVQSYTFFLLSFYFAFLPIFYFHIFYFVYFSRSSFRLPSGIPRVAFSKGNLCSLSDYRGWVCHSLGLTRCFFYLSFPSFLSMAGRRFLILILPRFLLFVHVGWNITTWSFLRPRKWQTTPMSP